MAASKIEVLDSLRAFAALSVCLFHFVYSTNGFIQTPWLLSVFEVGQYGVQTFFVISGFVIPWSMYQGRYKIKNFFSFFLKRVTRLEPPYLFSLILALLILYVRANYFGKSNEHIQVNAKQVALHIGYLIPFFKGYAWLNQVFWTLAVEFQYYFLMALLFIPLVNLGVIGRFVIYFVFIAFSFIGTGAFLLFWLPVFLLGIMLFLFKVKIVSILEYCFVTLCLLLFCGVKYSVFTAVYAAIPLACVLWYTDLRVNVLHFFGKFSYSIYLVHPILGASVINILSHYCNTRIEKFGTILLGLLVTFVTAWIMYLIVEKPSKKISSSIKY